MRRWSLLSHLLGLVVAVAAVTLTAGGYLTLQGYDDARDRASGQIRETVDLAARAVRQDLEETVTQARTLAPSLGPPISAAAAAGVPLSQACELAFSPQGVFTEGDQHILDPAGAVVCTSRRAALGTDYGGETWFADSAAGDPVLASVTRDPATGDRAVVVAMAVAGPDGRHVGTYLSVLEVAPVASTLGEIYGGTVDNAFLVVDGGGRTLSPSSSADAAGRPAPPVEEGETARDAGGIERIYSSSRVQATGWRVLGGVRRSAALAPAQAELRRRTIITATSLVALLLLALAVHRRLLRPVTVLSEAVTRARHERGVQAPVTGPAELAALAADLNALLGDRDRAEAELAASARALENSGRLLVEAREQERQQVGMRLHDGPIQEMVLTVWALDNLADQLPADTLAGVRRRLDSAIASSRAVQADLRQPKLDSGLSEAVGELVERRRADSSFGIEIDDHLEGARFPLHVELLVYRSVQDTIEHLRRNLRPSRVRISLWVGEGSLTAVVAGEDRDLDGHPGPGPPADALPGLDSIRDAVIVSGGRFHVGGDPGGLELRVVVPIDGEGAGS